MPFFSDVTIQQALPNNSDLSPDELIQLATDAGAMYGYINRTPGVADADLRRWGQSQSISPDRLNRALGLLRETGKVLEMPDAPPITQAARHAEPEPEPPPKKPRRRSSRAKS